jgi:hypothetical protein
MLELLYRVKLEEDVTALDMVLVELRQLCAVLEEGTARPLRPPLGALVSSIRLLGAVHSVFGPVFGAT